VFKFFCFSDCHGFYDELRVALDEAGFDPNNETHWAIGLGDYIDRGRQPQQVMDYLMSLPRKILVRGNHEQLIMECIDRGYPLSHDWHNGTAETIIDLALNAETFVEACAEAREKVKGFIDTMVDYAEMRNHIFVHSWIPTISQNGGFRCFNPNWRAASTKEWENSRWGNPFELAEQELMPDKTVVFGHYHTSYARNKYEDKPEFGKYADFSIYHGNGYIGIDGCCAYSGRVNVLVLEDEFLEG
jgi:serine/threonine protein phosphatase 1